MTAISSIIDEKNGVTYLASDRMGSNGFTGKDYKTKKVFHNGILSIAMCGSYRLGQILQHNLKPRNFEIGETIDNYVFNYLDLEIKKVLRERGYLQKENEIERLKEAEAIIAIKDRIFILQGDFAFLEPERIYATSGSGRYHQEASIHTQLMMNPKKDYKEVLRDAIKYTSSIVMSVGGEPDIIIHKHN